MNCCCKYKEDRYYEVSYFDENMTGYGGYCDDTDDLDYAISIAQGYETHGMMCAGVYEKRTGENVYAVGKFK